jgi:hypothetical protein
MPEPLTTPRELLAVCLRQMLWIEQKLAEEVLPELSGRARATDLKLNFDRATTPVRARAARIDGWR